MDEINRNNYNIFVMYNIHYESMICTCTTLD